MEEARVREKIAGIIFYDKLPKDYGECFEKATQILAIKLGSRTLKEWIELYEKDKLRIVVDDQSLPENPYVSSSLIPLSEGHIGYAEAQQDMLKPDSEGNVWVKVLPKKE